MRDVAAVANVTAAAGVPLKVILETCLLTNEEIAAVSSACRALGVEWIKTSTGFSTGGATVEDVALMHSQGTSPTGALPVQVKASGGIRTLNDALGVIKAGASRIGASAGVGIMQELEELHETSPTTATRMLAEDGVVMQQAPEGPHR